MYTAYKLSEHSRKVLFLMYPPKYSEFIGHHITEEFGVQPDTPLPDVPVLVQVVGYVDTRDGLEGFTVEIDGDDTRPDGKLYHITWSLDPSKYKPVDTNNYAGDAESIRPVSIRVEPRIFK